MDILWAATGICAIVFVAFFILAQHWRAILREQSSAIRRLNHRLRDMQEMADPEFRKRISESSPMPLDQVFLLTFAFSDRFWRDRLGMRAENWELARSLSTIVASVKLEVWRSHTFATVTELLPAGSPTDWQTRSLDFYPNTSSQKDYVILWELRVGVPKNATERMSTLELILRPSLVELRVLHPAQNKLDEGTHHSPGSHDDEEEEDVILLIPLDHDTLAKYRTHDPTDSQNGSPQTTEGLLHGKAWQSFYSHADELAGIEWRVRLLDLSKKAQWERWKILDSPVIGHGAYRQ